MALHRDIYWLGRQWAVTGHGLQLIDQKRQGFFDIEASRLWEEGLIEGMMAKEWLNKADFDKGLAFARARYPKPPQEIAPPPPELDPPADPKIDALAAPTEAVPPITNSIPSLPPLPKFGAARSQAAPNDLPPPIAEIVQPVPAISAPGEPPKPSAASFQMRIAGSAKFAVPWRLRPKQ
jgi:hypothetical protein